MDFSLKTTGVLQFPKPQNRTPINRGLQRGYFRKSQTLKDFIVFIYYMKKLTNNKILQSPFILNGTFSKLLKIYMSFIIRSQFLKSIKDLQVLYYCHYKFRNYKRLITPLLKLRLFAKH